MALRLVAKRRYSPPASYQTFSTVLVNVDAANLFLDFSSHEANEVLIQLSAPCRLDGSAPATALYFGLRDSAGAVASSKRIVADYPVGKANMVYRHWMNITPGLNYLWFWAYCVQDAGTPGNILNATDSGDQSELVMEAFVEEFWGR